MPGALVPVFRIALAAHLRRVVLERAYPRKVRFSALIEWSMKDMVVYMHAASIKVTAVLMSLVVAAAAHACLCLGMERPSLQRSDAHACCKKNLAAKVPIPQKSDDPCKQCNVRNPHTITVPEKDFSFITTFAFNDAIAAPIFQMAPQLAGFIFADDVPIPPLLQDLHHTFCQLTV